jgi:hypothetical protein
MNEKVRQNSWKALWICTLAVLAILTVQGFSGNWITLFLILPGGSANLGDAFIQAMAGLASYHVYMGFAIGVFSILEVTLAFISRSSIYVRILAVLGLAITFSAALGGYLFVSSGYRDRWPLGQMMDSFIGAYVAYFLQLFFMNRTPRFPWTKAG